MAIKWKESALGAFVNHVLEIQNDLIIKQGVRVYKNHFRERPTVYTSTDYGIISLLSHNISDKSSAHAQSA